MSKSFLRCRRIWLLTIGFFCTLWDRKRSSEGRGMGGRWGRWYPSCRRVPDFGGGGIGGGWEDAGGSGWLDRLRQRKCRIWSAGTPVKASSSSSPLPVTEEAVTGPVFHRTSTLVVSDRGGWRVQEAGIRPSVFRGLACLWDVAED